jgi:hypothetical protein
LWLLAVPVHLDPAHGLVWGSALLWGLALSLAIEAMWSGGQWVGCGLIALGVVDLLWAAPPVLYNLAWNPYLPLPFLIATMAIAFQVARGRFGWWPVLVVTASLAAQTHLFYVLPSVALVLFPPLVGYFLSGRPTTLKWLTGGLGVAGLCWIAPLIQAFGANSNVAALARGTEGVSTLGIGFGFRLVGDSADAIPIWLQRAPTRFYPDMAFAFGHQPLYGIGAVCLLVAICIFGLLVAQPALVAAGTITLIVTVAFAVSFAMIPARTLIVVDYLLVVAWLLGFAVWIVVIWCLMSIIRSLLSWEASTRIVAIGGSALLFLTAGGLAIGVTRAISADPNFGTNWTPAEAAEVGRIVSLVERTSTSKVVTVVIDGPNTDPLLVIAVGEGVGLRLVLDGWRPGIQGVAPVLTRLPPKAGSVEVSVRVRPDS